MNEAELKALRKGMVRAANMKRALEQMPKRINVKPERTYKFNPNLEKL